mmetsp:Transcript_3838/g.10797  ORF Transcript_3838/g.10797 Transcript_3838/m.10797 type:complete len:270 (+) Transcript_3838:333-1142(+)
MAPGRSVRELLHHLHRHGVHGVDLLETAVAEERAPGDPKEGVEDVGHVLRLVRYATTLCILAPQDEAHEALAVDPVQAVERGEAREHPPRVAHVRELLWPPVEATGRELSLAEPPAERVPVDAISRTGNSERAHTAEDLSCVGLAPGRGSVAAIEVLARGHEVCCLGHVHRIQAPEQGETVERAIAEPRINFAPLVAGKGAIRPLKAGHVAHGGVDVNVTNAPNEKHDLHRGEGVEHVRVVAHIATKAARIRMLTLLHKAGNEVEVHVT